MKSPLVQVQTLESAQDCANSVEHHSHFSKHPQDFTSSVILVAVLVLLFFLHPLLNVPVPSAGPVHMVHESWVNVFCQKAGAREA